MKTREETRAYYKVWREKHPGCRREYMQKYRDEHKEELRVYLTGNREERLEVYRNYRREHKEEQHQYKMDRKEYYSKQARIRLLRNHGMSQEEYDAMLLSQDGVCAICGNSPEENKHLHIDHDHITGKVRALLCSKCNTAIGLADDDVNRLFGMAIYINDHRCGR